MINGAAFNDRIGEGVVVEPRGMIEEGSLSLANLIGRSGIDAPVETENAGGVVRLEALGFWRGGENKKIGRGAGKEDKQGDRSPLRAKNRPIGGAGALQAGMDDVFRAMRLVGLRNEAAALGEKSDEFLGKAGKRAERQMADAVESCVACEQDLAGFVERRGGQFLSWEQGTGAEQSA